MNTKRTRSIVWRGCGAWRGYVYHHYVYFNLRLLRYILRCSYIRHPTRHVRVIHDASASWWLIMHRVLPGPKYPRVLLFRNRTIAPSSRPTVRGASSATKMSYSAPVPRDMREFLDGYPRAELAHESTTTRRTCGSGASRTSTSCGRMFRRVEDVSPLQRTVRPRLTLDSAWPPRFLVCCATNHEDDDARRGFPAFPMKKNR